MTTEPVLVDEYLEGALELDVNVLCDGRDAWVAGILEHIEPAGVHSGDSACVFPVQSVTGCARRRDPGRWPRASSHALGARGLLNLQVALRGRRPLRDRGEPARLPDDPLRGEGHGDPARRPRLQAPARRLRWRRANSRLGAIPIRVWAKEAIFPSDRFAGAADRGPEMKSTGEVMAGGDSAVAAYRRALRGRGPRAGERRDRPAASGPDAAALGRNDPDEEHAGGSTARDARCLLDLDVLVVGARRSADEPVDEGAQSPRRHIHDLDPVRPRRRDREGWRPSSRKRHPHRFVNALLDRQQELPRSAARRVVLRVQKPEGRLACERPELAQQVVPLELRQGNRPLEHAHEALVRV